MDIQQLRAVAASLMRMLCWAALAMPCKPQVTTSCHCLAQLLQNRALQHQAAHHAHGPALRGSEAEWLIRS